ncbi:MAG: polysaccharide deacetylase family protein [Myxococcales bacterium]|nr:polysaccharide deacetylase family protein [Myxococcales bacterium]MCB9534219.1 polysaccharide deacetylase family protein [Myxococcales bacterium]
MTAVTVDVEADFASDSLRATDVWLPWLLDLFDEHAVQATFFVVGAVARRRPALPAALRARGHVVASHGQTHRPLTQLGAKELDLELRDSKAAIEDCAGAACTGFRAPFFAAPPHLYAALATAGYAWSSSMAPLSPISGPRLRRRQQAVTSVVEIPVPRLGRLPVPDGLSYRRLLWPVSRHVGAPSVFYLHPYELTSDPSDFALPAAWRPLMLVRSGSAARSILSDLLGDWQRDGAAFAALPHAAEPARVAAAI